MKAAYIDEYGGPDVLKYGDLPDPVPGPDEILVKVAAASINPVDTMERSGETKAWNPLKFPCVLGWDLSGTVQALGAGVTHLKVGDKVFAWAFHTYAELCVVAADLVAKVPEGLDLVEVAALPLASLTGSQLISVGAGVKAGQTVLVSGAVGAVGRAAVFAAKDLGAHVIAGVQTKRLSEADALGADRVLALDDESAVQALPYVDAVANTVRGRTAERLLLKVKPGGVFASATGAPANATEYPSVRTVAFVSKKDPKGMLYIAEAVLAKKLAIPIGRKLGLRNAASGHVLVERGGSGKVLLVP